MAHRGKHLQCEVVAVHGPKCFRMILVTYLCPAFWEPTSTIEEKETGSKINQGVLWISSSSCYTHCYGGKSFLQGHQTCSIVQGSSWTSSCAPPLSLFITSYARPSLDMWPVPMARYISYLSLNTGIERKSTSKSIYS